MTEYSNDLLILAEDALNHAILSVADGGDLIPFVMRETKEGRSMRRFFADRLEDCVEIARQTLQIEPAPYRAALAFDGFFISGDGERIETLFVDAYEAGDAGGLVLAQRTKKVGPLKKEREPFGDIFVASPNSEPLF